MRGLRRCQIHTDAERLNHVGAANRRGDGAIAVLGHGHARGGAQDGDGGGDVERAQAVAAGADDVEDFAGFAPGVFNRRRDGFVAQGAGEVGDFLRRFALFCEGGQEVSLGSGGNFFAGKPFNRLPYLRFCKCLRGVELSSQLFERFRHGRIVRLRAPGSNRKLHGQTA